MKSYPINLDLADKEVLVVGGGKVAYRKLKRLVDAETYITLVSPQISNNINKLISKEEIEFLPRKFKRQDIEGKFLIIAATDKKEINQEIGQLAIQKDKLVNVVDNVELSNFTLPATIEQGDLLLTVATGGNLPALSRVIRQKLEVDFGSEFACFLKLMSQIRPVVLEELAQEEMRRKVFRQLADLELINLLTEDRETAIKRIEEILAEVDLKIDLK
ncbi:bifunctional precorrin-2 dehydrogenase/sirohydrochlorin ferrochelatase [Halanaerocella petrolearia]